MPIAPGGFTQEPDIPFMPMGLARQSIKYAGKGLSRLIDKLKPPPIQGRRVQDVLGEYAKTVGGAENLFPKIRSDVLRVIGSNPQDPVKAFRLQAAAQKRLPDYLRKFNKTQEVHAAEVLYLNSLHGETLLRATNKSAELVNWAQRVLGRNVKEIAPVAQKKLPGALKSATPKVKTIIRRKK